MAQNPEKQTARLIPGADGPLATSYTYHSPTPTVAGPYILGVDEAGRGPTLGPLVYGVAYCASSRKDDLEEMAFADSKTLTAETRRSLLETLSGAPDFLGWSVRVICPQAISSGMLRKPPINLNKQSEEATILLIREVLQRGLQLSEIYVDTLGNPVTYQAYLSSLFPGIEITVAKKADSLYRIVGAASIAAKVNRDAWIEGWIFEEEHCNSQEGTEKDDALTAFGSGYPSDPNTKKWLEANLEPTFGYPSIARFSWGTIKVALDKAAHSVKWIDEGEDSLIKAFESGTPRDQGRCTAAKDLCIRSIGML
ncbi:ribonuclease HII [Gloeophyllum trabeum ATCC 11539]|uniref:Ribonuclease n=1 Tax=Gloeophyllum trabeum (strain ATCC 11539 / FP-39264 / Madison 617) TaxID=670483 RepID=S7Q3U1_GLOTA|nr:ribonuclease HII [Gloeophyllum trabeum ATCC 11539]EPQ54108.1 ribonuclease HII [Gloeophyllum trabeum ATCC 11539]